jgi:hypothetical protein
MGMIQAQMSLNSNKALQLDQGKQLCLLYW